MTDFIVSAPFLILLAWTIEATVGWPDWLFSRVRHPVVWIGALISWLEQWLNQPDGSLRMNYAVGAGASLLVVFLTAAIAVMISAALPNNPMGVLIEAVIASSLLASRSLYRHVAAVGRPLQIEDLDGARAAVAKIVGRDPQSLDEAGVARASLESLAENASDGVIAPLFWGACLGLPGLAAYKAINTLDSMIGHKTQRYRTYGGFAARLDDVANYLPARLTAILIAFASTSTMAVSAAIRDARRHRSFNAGWPEAAMAGALNVRLSGPRRYGTTQTDEPWLNASFPDPTAAKIRDGLNLYARAMVLAFFALGAITLLISL